MTRLLLASASPARLETLRNAGVHALVQVSGVDEDAALRDAVSRFGELTPDQIALVLARAKAEDVANDLEHDEVDLVLGCDSVLELDGEIHGKPRTPQEAVARWRRMAGRRGVLHTGHWLIDTRTDDEGTGATIGSTASTTVLFGDIDDEEIASYIATGEPMRVAGAFTVDGLGGPYIDAVDGDYHNVVGLSLPLLRQLVAELHIPWRCLRCCCARG